MLTWKATHLVVAMPALLEAYKVTSAVTARYNNTETCVIVSKVAIATGMETPFKLEAMLALMSTILPINGEIKIVEPFVP
jgi:hypothetical protein